MRSAIASTLFAMASCLLVGTGAGARDNVATPSQAKEGQVNVDYSGVVKECKKDSITIQFGDEKPKKFAVSEVLAAGQVPMLSRPTKTNRRPTIMASLMYRLSDVRVGDHVMIFYARIDGVDICDHICIHKRPGGLVPPLPDEAEALRRPLEFPGQPPRRHISYHEYMNAHWDLEDRGIAFPAWFGDKRRFPTAPAPREKR